ncbi:MAG: RagB/SusD family nutrient uptake outer membrane protein [Bacteroidales bacterium]|nr:RagB/SusD family nutrient uptake outer membrane protein [Bacteroidales bacterium]
MKAKNIIRNFSLGLLLLTLSSCGDWLEITPLNDIVLENFWTDKTDVENVVASCYTALLGSDVVSRMLIWGELRSDNMVQGQGIPDAENEILRANILQTNPYTNWTCFYNVINRCNTVLYYAPMVAQKDPNFNESSLKAIEAEAKALRALCYFYLMRTFRDVPYASEPSVDDNQRYDLAPTPFDELLQILIQDLEGCKDYAIKAYGNKAYNTGRITRDAIHALLADLYLWDQDYDNCIRYCDLVIQSKREQYNELNKDKEELASNEYPLIEAETPGSSVTGNSYNQVFGTGNSTESIFELYFLESPGRLTNTTVSRYYGSVNAQRGYLGAPDFIGRDRNGGSNVFLYGNEVFAKKDVRSREYIGRSSGGVFPITKYAYRSVSNENGVYRSTDFANWIIYRLSDVMLMKAEALTNMISETAEEDTASSEAAQAKILLSQSFELVRAVYNRSNPEAGRDSLNYTNYSSKDNMNALILAERQRELMFEGKRWFDLVRMARREGNNAKLVDMVISKYTENQSTIRTKMMSVDALYFPYNEEELKVNSYLKQNPVYITETSSITR